MWETQNKFSVPCFVLTPRQLQQALQGESVHERSLSSLAAIQIKYTGEGKISKWSFSELTKPTESILLQMVGSSAIWEWPCVIKLMRLWLGGELDFYCPRNLRSVNWGWGWTRNEKSLYDTTARSQAKSSSDQSGTGMRRRQEPK